MYRVLWGTTATAGLLTMYLLGGMVLWHAAVMATTDPGQAGLLLSIGVLTVLLFIVLLTATLDAITRREIRARQRSTR